MTVTPTANPADPKLSARPTRGRFVFKGRWGGYVVAVLAVAIATALDIALWGSISPNASPLYIAAIMVTGWFGGLGPGLFATALAAGASVYLFIEPVYSFQVSPPDALRLTVFLAVALLISWLNARRKAAEQAVEAARASLERKVADRTNDLEKINIELRDQQKQLRELSWQVSQTQEQERRRIATALHDGLAQVLAVASIRIDAIRKNGGDVPDDDLKLIHSLLDEALTQTRSLTIDLSPPVLYELGLKAAINWLAQEMNQRYRLKVEVACAALPEIDEVTRSVLFHSIRELLINVAKHAGAATARVSISFGAGVIDALVEDDGRGFDSGDALAHVGGRGGFGLFNVRERIHHLAGTFRVSPRDPQGTRVHLTAPIKRIEASHE